MAGPGQGMSEAIAAQDAGHAVLILLLKRWLKGAATLLGTDDACVIASEGDTARVLARFNLPHAFITTHNTIEKAPYAPDERVVLRDATGRPDIHAFLGTIAREQTGFFFRRPLQIAKGRVISLLVFGRTALPDLADRELALVDEIAGCMEAEIERHYPPGSKDLAASMQLSMPDVRRWIDGTDLPAVLFDAGRTLLHVNAKLRALLPIRWDDLEGRPLSDIALPARTGIDLLFRRALETGISTPRMDVALEESADGGIPRMLRVVGSPIRLVDGQAVLVATLDPSLMPEPPEIAGFGRHGDNATAEFLLETLVQRRALRGRKDVSYVTLRSWRNSIRAHQIKALKALKRNAPESLAGEIAGEMSDDIRSLFGVGGFRAVVPMPCGHSAPGRCLSAAIGNALAKELALPVLHALSLPAERGSSHPKTNVKRQPMSLLTAVEGPILLIDDVATSGRHIEEATLLLRGAGSSVLAIAWIGGDAEKASGESEEDDV
jgi:predicted amidophosphoribosyltransferase